MTITNPSIETLMNDYRVTDLGRDLQDAHREMLRMHQYSHWVTLNFHSKPTRPDRVLHRWSFDVIDRLFRHQQFAGVPMGELFHFAAYPEYTRRDRELHYHLPTFVHPHRHAWFSSVAGDMWKRIVKSGTADIQLIDRTPDKVNHYATKMTSRGFSHDQFITSNMLDLPAFGGPRSWGKIAA